MAGEGCGARQYSGKRRAARRTKVDALRRLPTPSDAQRVPSEYLRAREEVAGGAFASKARARQCRQTHACGGKHMHGGGGEGAPFVAADKSADRRDYFANSAASAAGENFESLTDPGYPSILTITSTHILCARAHPGFSVKLPIFLKSYGEIFCFFPHYAPNTRWLASAPISSGVRSIRSWHAWRAQSARRAAVSMARLGCAALSCRGWGRPQGGVAPPGVARAAPRPTLLARERLSAQA